MLYYVLYISKHSLLINLRIWVAMVISLYKEFSLLKYIRHSYTCTCLIKIVLFILFDIIIPDFTIK